MDLETFRLVCEVIVLPAGGVVWYLLRKVIAEAREQEKETAVRFAELEKGCSEKCAALEKDLAEYKLHVAMTHPTQDHLSKAIEGFTDSIREIFGKLDSIRGEIKNMSDSFRDKLDTKADREAR